MALITAATDASIDASTAMYAPQITGLITGEAILMGAPCYIKTSNNKIYMSNGTALNEAAEFVGIAPRAAGAGEPLTLYGFSVRFRYGTALTPGDLLYIGATAGRYDAAATTGDTLGTLQVLTPTDVRVIRTTVVGA